MLKKRTDFKIEVDTLSHSHARKNIYGRWSATAGEYEWRVRDKETNEIIAHGRCRGKSIAVSRARQKLLAFLNYNPSHREHILE